MLSKQNRINLADDDIVTLTSIKLHFCARLQETSHLIESHMKPLQIVRKFMTKITSNML